MSCYNKKKLEESGVSLTERTCSPYNPIIKQIVDDCLGLPIYPVTSVDAVIDEEGNTLRDLLEELSNLTGESNPEYIKIWQKINEILQTIKDLEDIYLTENSTVIVTIRRDLETLKELVRYIARMGEESNLDYYSNGVPYIVKVINDLRDAIGDNDSPESLMGKLRALTLLVKAIAEYDTQYLYGDSPMIPIISKIEELSNWEIPLDLEDRLTAIQESITAILEELLKKANLDDELLQYGVLKLEANEYPITSAKFVQMDVLSDLYSTLSAGIYYFTDAYHIQLSERNRCDVLPVRALSGDHRDLWELSDIDGNPIIVDGNKLYAGDTVIGLLELGVIKNKIQRPVEMAYGYEAEQLYILNGPKHCTILDVNQDDEVTLGDYNRAREVLFDLNNRTNAVLSVFGRSHILQILPSLEWIWHPLIDGKVYVDTITNTPYRFKASLINPRMIPLTETTIEVNGTGLTLQQSVVSDLDEVVGKKYTLTMQQLEVDNIQLEQGDNITIQDVTQEGESNTTYRISADIPQLIALASDDTINIETTSENPGDPITYTISANAPGIEGDVVTKVVAPTPSDYNYKVEGIVAKCNVVENISEPAIGEYYITPAQYDVYKVIREVDDDTFSQQLLVQNNNKFPTIYYTSTDVTKLLDFILGSNENDSTLMSKIYKHKLEELINYWYNSLYPMYLELDSISNKTPEQTRKYNILVTVKNYLETYIVDNLPLDPGQSTLRSYDDFATFIDNITGDIRNRPVGYATYTGVVNASQSHFSIGAFSIYVLSLINLANGEIDCPFTEVYRRVDNANTYYVFKFTPNRLYSRKILEDIIMQIAAVDDKLNILSVTEILNDLLDQKPVDSVTVTFENLLYQIGSDNSVHPITLGDDAGKLNGVIFINNNAQDVYNKYWTFDGESMKKLLPLYSLQREADSILLYEDSLPNSIININLFNSINKLYVSFIATDTQLLAVCTDHNVVLIYDNAIVSNPYDTSNLSINTPYEFSAFAVPNASENAYAEVATYTYTKENNQPSD